MVQPSAPGKGITILLTGGSGFLGSFLVRELLGPGCPFPVEELRIYDLNRPENTGDQRIRWIEGDIRDREKVHQACSGAGLVIHSAAIVDWGTRPEQEVMEVNFTGTLHVIEGCRMHGTGILLFTSSLDVLYDGRPLVGVDEQTPYPERHSNAYCRSKYLAERAVLEASGNGLTTTALRPSDIYGEGDPYHMGSLIRMAKQGFYVRLGNGKARCQHVYAGNAAYAHVLAAARLLDGTDRLAGQAYFITDGPGSNFFTFFDRLVEGAGYRIRPRNLWIPRRAAGLIGTVSEWIAFAARPVKRYSPKMSRFAVTYTCTDYTFSSDKARRDFGYIPRYSEEEAIRRTVSFYRREDRIFSDV